MRQEFERHRFVKQLPVVDVLIFNSHSEFQVRRNSALAFVLSQRWWGSTIKSIRILRRWTGNDELLETSEPRAEVLEG